MRYITYIGPVTDYDVSPKAADVSLLRHKQTEMFEGKQTEDFKLDAKRGEQLPGG
jgi:hypothetical protein